MPIIMLDSCRHRDYTEDIRIEKQTMKELLKLIGKTGSVNSNGLVTYVKILDIKKSYGRTRYQVTPLKGEGEVWVEDVTIN